MESRISRGKLIGLLFDYGTKPVLVAKATGETRQYIHFLMKKYGIKIIRKTTIEFEKKLDK